MYEKCQDPLEVNYLDVIACKNIILAKSKTKHEFNQEPMLEKNRQEFAFQLNAF